MNSENSSTGTVFLALLGGAVLGAGVALLYAPQSGRRSRQKLKDMAEDAEDYARELLERAEEGVERAGRKGGQWLQKGQDFAQEKKRKLSAAVDGVKGTH